MSVATEFAPVVEIPAHARLHPDHHRTPDDSTARDGRAGHPGRVASVTRLHRPSARPAAASVRLTRRGALVLGAAVAVLAGALVGAAWLSAPGSAAGSARAPVPAAVTVHSGDSLWSIAQRVAPGVDPRAEVATLQRVNHLAGSALVPGQVLRTG